MHIVLIVKDIAGIVPVTKRSVRKVHRCPVWKPCMSKEWDIHGVFPHVNPMRFLCSHKAAGNFHWLNVYNLGHDGENLKIYKRNIEVIQTTSALSF